MYHEDWMLGVPRTEPGAFKYLPNMIRLDAGTISLTGFACSGEPVMTRTYAVEVDGDTLRVLRPPIAGVDQYTATTDVRIRAGESCGEIIQELLRPTSSDPLVVALVLGELCLTNSCDETPEDDQYQVDLCPNTITECVQ